jgi:hypothetical protein
LQSALESDEIEVCPVPNPLSAPLVVQPSPRGIKKGGLIVGSLLILMGIPGIGIIFSKGGLSIGLLLFAIVTIVPGVFLMKSLPKAMQTPRFAADQLGIWMRTDGAQEVRLSWPHVERIAIVRSVKLAYGGSGPTTLYGRRIRIWPISERINGVGTHSLPLDLGQQDDLVRKWSSNIQFCDPSDDQISSELDQLSAGRCQVG